MRKEGEDRGSLSKYFHEAGDFGKNSVQGVGACFIQKSNTEKENLNIVVQQKKQNLCSPWSVRGGGKDEGDRGNGNDTRGLWGEFPAFTNREGQEWVWERLWQPSFVSIRGHRLAKLYL